MLKQLAFSPGTWDLERDPKTWAQVEVIEAGSGVANTVAMVRNARHQVLVAPQSSSCGTNMTVFSLLMSVVSPLFSASGSILRTTRYLQIWCFLFSWPELIFIACHQES